MNDLLTCPHCGGTFEHAKAIKWKQYPTFTNLADIDLEEAEQRIAAKHFIASGGNFTQVNLGTSEEKCFAVKGTMTECEKAGNLKEQEECKFFCKASGAERCMYEVFKTLCDNPNAQKEAK